MSGLFETGTETFALSQISSIRLVDSRPGRASYYSVSWKGGGATVSLADYEYADLMNRPLQILPADAGTRLVMVYPERDDEAGFVDALPILAWALCVDGQMRPVLPSGVRRTPEFQAATGWHPDYVQLPDGWFYEMGYDADHGRWPNVDAVLNHEKLRAARYSAEVAKQAAAATEAAS